MLSTICTAIAVSRADVIEQLLQRVFDKYNMTLEKDRAAFIAQVCHESGEFTIKSENMMYTTPQRIVDIWPTRFSLAGGNGKLMAADYCNHPEKLANEVYANRMGNGDQASGDGYRFRGAGFLQLTGRESFERYAAYINKDIHETAQLVRTDDYYAMDAAAWEYVIDKKLPGVTDFVLITKRINGGTIGLAERRKYYQRAVAALIPDNEDRRNMA